MAIGDVIYKRLHDDAAIAAAVGTAIYPEYRDDVLPALVYQLELDSTDQMYDGVGCETHELAIHCVAATHYAADALATLVKARLADTDWTDGDWRALGCFWRDKSTDQYERNTKNQRLTDVVCRFDFLIANSNGD